MFSKRHRSPKLFSDFNMLQFASVIAMGVFIPLLILMNIRPHGSISVDQPRVSHRASMHGALREDALKITITRDGRVWFGTDPLYSGDLSTKLRRRLADRGVERKVYILADMRAQWGDMKPVLDGVRAAGILRVSFLVR